MPPISTRTKRLVAGALVVGVLAFLYVIHHVLAPFLVALLLVYILNPLVDWLAVQQVARRAVGRKGAVVLVFLGFFSVVGLGGLLLAPQIYAEGTRLTREMPELIRDFEYKVVDPLVASAQGVLDSSGIAFNAREHLDTLYAEVMQSGEGQTASLLKKGQMLVKGVFSTIFSVVLVFMATAFLLLDWHRIKANLLALFPESYRGAAATLGGNIDRGLAGAIRGQLLVCLINGVLTTLGLMLLQIKFAMTIGVIAGFFSLIPIFGTVISTIPAVLIALTQGWWVALEVVLLICVIHLIEANFLNPNVLGHHSEIHPVLVLFALMVGEHYAGAIGLLFAVPMAAILRALLSFAYQMVMAAPPEATALVASEARPMAETAPSPSI